jgi:salicylate hydroxylase
VQGDSLIGCDGLHSVVRTAVVGEAPARFTGQTAWRGLARMPVAGAARVQVWTGPRRHFVRYPVGEGLVNIVAVAEATGDDVESWDQTGEAARLARAFADWPEPVRATIAAVDQPWRSALYDRPPLTRWTAGRISLLGDAAHPMLPFLAQGAAMAIEDAWVAADLLARHEPDVALKAYERARLDRTAKAQAWASRNAALFHLPSPVAAGVFGAAGWLDKARGVAPEARFDWLYGWRPAAI